MNSNEFELAKISMINLIHGVNENNEFIASAHKLGENQKEEEIKKIGI